MSNSNTTGSEWNAGTTGNLPDANEAGIKKLVYHISDEWDIINHFSTEGFELLSASFVSFMDLKCPTDADKAPILLEITGKQLDEKQQRKIDNAIWLHYRLRMTRLARNLKSCRVKTLWFFICTLLSSMFLYMVTKQTSEVATQFYYLPIWFFGYRLLTYPLQNYLPLRRELQRCRRLAAMKLVFSEKPLSAVSESIADAAREENAVYYDQAIDGIRNAELTKNFIKEDGTVLLGCRAESAEELMNPCSVPGGELISEELAAFLDQAEPFVNPEKAVELEVSGVSLSETERTKVSAAIREYAGLRYRQAVCELSDSRRKIVSYALGLIVSSVLLYLCGKSAGLAMHEFLLISMWFFGDYLVEFILIGLSDAKYMVRLRRRLMDIKICFQSDSRRLEEMQV